MYKEGMPTIRPISDLRNKLSELTQVVLTKEPVFLTKGGEDIWY